MLIRKDTNFTAESAVMYVVDTSGGNITVTLPDATEDAAFYFHNAGVNHIIYVTQNNQTIDDVSDYINEVLGKTDRLFTDGANWYNM